MIPDSALTELIKILGEKNIITAETEMLTYAHDKTSLEFMPDAVVFPSNEIQISKILQLANRERFPVIPRGAGSGMSGGALALRGGLVIAMNKLDRVLLIDQNNLIAKVQPGVITGHFQQEVEKRGLFYPPDPASLDVSTIGGNVAECAGGPRAVKYGVTRDYILGMKIVLPTGEVLSTGVDTAKGVVGYDLTRLIVGSEGTLAIITEITLRLIPKPPTKTTMLVMFPQVRTAADCVSRMIRENIVPAAIEFMDYLSMQCVKDQLSFDIPGGESAVLLIELDGDQYQVTKDAEKIIKLCRKMGVSDYRLAHNEKEADDLWQARRNLSPALLTLKPHKINQDVVVPRSCLPELVLALSRIGKEYRLPIPSFGHAGDGNIHVNIMFNRDENDEADRAHQSLQEILRTVIDLGGTISGEHGIGITKKPYIGMEITPTGLGLMRRIKHAFDPEMILNPGKIFDMD